MIHYSYSRYETIRYRAVAVAIAPRRCHERPTDSNSALSRPYGERYVALAEVQSSWRSPNART